MRGEKQAADERKLLEELSQGQEHAFTFLYNRYSGKLYTRILRIVKCEETAKEILQDIFMKVWELRSRTDSERSFRSYIYRIAENRIFDHFRKAARDKRLANQLIASAMTFYSPVEDAALGSDNLQLVQKAIDQLPPVRKQVFTLCKLEGKTYEEISVLLSISTSTVSDHIVKANRALKNYLLQHPDIVLTWAIGSFLKDCF